MRIAAISDLHGNLPDYVPECDVIVIAGDICPDLRPIERQADWMDTSFRTWLETLNRFVLATPGNHDFCIERRMTPSLPWHLSIDAMVILEGIKFYCTPWVPWLPMWAYSGHGDVPESRRNAIPEDTDVLISHGPPYGMLDNTASLHHVGSETLLARVSEITPEVVICGHIHEARGTYIAPFGTRIVNVASLDELYDPYPNRWTTIDIDEVKMDTPVLLGTISSLDKPDIS